MTVELRTPPASAVPWTITRRDGLIGTRIAKTAWLAAADLGWSFQDCIDFQQETPIDRHEPVA